MRLYDFVSVFILGAAVTAAVAMILAAQMA